MPNRIVAYRRDPGTGELEAAEMWEASAHDAAARHPGEWSLEPWPGQASVPGAAPRPVDGEDGEVVVQPVQPERPKMAVVEPGTGSRRGR